jgi:hypothetical protein
MEVGLRLLVGRFAALVDRIQFIGGIDLMLLDEYILGRFFRLHQPKAESATVVKDGCKNPAKQARSSDL